MVDFKALSKFDRLSRAKQEMTILDRDGIADLMRQNLASDIVNGRHGLNSVTRQIIAIEDYEETTRSMRARIKEENL